MVLMSTTRTQVSPLLLRLEGCDCESDSPHLFDVDEPSGEYKLDMSLPYSRMVASELVALSQSKKGFEVTTGAVGVFSAVVVVVVVVDADVTDFNVVCC